MVVAMRLEGHPCSLHFLDLLPAQESFPANVACVDKEFCPLASLKEKGKGDLVVRAVAVIEGQCDWQLPSLGSVRGIPQLMQQYSLVALPADASQMVAKLGGRDPVFPFAHRALGSQQVRQTVIEEHGCATEPEPAAD